MFYLKDILYGIESRKKTAALIVLQLTFTLFVSYSILNIYFTGTILSSSSKWAMKNIDDIYLINGESDSLIRNNELYIKAINEVEKENLGKIGMYSAISISLNGIFNKDSNVVGLSINKNYYDMLNNTLILGEGFKENDFILGSPEVTPIILGNDYKNKCKLYDIVEEKYSGKKYIIKGFFKPNKYLIESNYNLSGYINSKNCFIIPMTEDIGYIGSVIKFNGRESSNIKMHELVFENMKNAIKIDVDEFFNSNKQWSPFLIMSLVASLVGIIISTILSIVFRRREYGIRIVLGESLKEILFKVTIENIILSTLAIICTEIFTYIMNKDFIKATNFVTTESIIYINFNIEFFLPCILIIMIITFITSIIVFKIIKRIEPKELIGGID